MTDPPIIRFEGVFKAFGSNVVYEDMNLAIRKGETVAIIGGSGQGKSVCMKMIVGLLRADEGHVYFRDQEVGQLNPTELRELRRKVAYVFQGGALFDSMTVGENVGYALTEHTRMGDGEIRERVVHCLQMVGLGMEENPQILDSMPANLSGGMRKRVALARSIALEPEVILYDEPTTGLDPSNCTVVSTMIRHLQQQLGVTSLVVTHDMPTAFHVADRMAMLHDRKFPFVDTVEKFRFGDNTVVRDFVEGRTD